MLLPEPPAATVAHAHALFAAKLAGVHPELTRKYRGFLRDLFFLGAYETLESLLDLDRGVDPVRVGAAISEAVAGPEPTRREGPIARDWANLKRSLQADPPLGESTYYHGAYSALKLVTTDAT